MITQPEDICWRCKHPFSQHRRELVTPDLPRVVWPWACTDCTCDGWIDSAGYPPVSPE